MAVSETPQRDGGGGGRGAREGSAASGEDRGVLLGGCPVLDTRNVAVAAMERHHLSSHLAVPGADGAILYVYICVCIYVCIHIDMVHMVLIYTYIYIYICVCIYVHIYIGADLLLHLLPPPIRVRRLGLGVLAAIASLRRAQVPSRRRFSRFRLELANNSVIRHGKEFVTNSVQFYWGIG